jgi:predicted component of type VI protein secretion system
MNLVSAGYPKKELYTIPKSATLNYMFSVQKFSCLLKVIGREI